MKCASFLTATLLISYSCDVSLVKETPPNILFVLIDDMGWKDMGCAGSSYFETPNIDRMAEEGVRFLNAYSASPVCTPSRGAIFSGKNPARTKLTTPHIGPDGPDERLHERSKYQGENDQHLEALHRRVLPKGEVILAQALSEGGYKTGFFGKWHIGECPGYYPDERGFHIAKGYRLRAAGTGLSGHWMKTFYEYGANLDNADREAYLADVLTDECIQFITENKDKSWLAVLSHYLVHLPISPKPEKLEYYENKPTTDQSNPGYAAMVESVDESVGRLMDALEQLGLTENTLIIFTSDNGGMTPGPTSNYPLMGGKSFPFEAGMKVPFIVRWPGNIEPGISEQRIIGMDIYPTMLAASNLPQRPEQHLDGTNLMPLLTKNKVLNKRPLFFHYPHYTHATGPFSSIIADDWKLIRFYNDEYGSYLLYDLATDPQEQINLAETEATIRDRLTHMLDSLLIETDALMPIVNTNYTSGAGRGRFNLKFTKELAERERALFEERLGN